MLGLASGAERKNGWTLTEYGGRHGLVNADNDKFEHGDLVLEEICQGSITQADAVAALSVTDMAIPYRMAAIQGRVVQIRPDQDCLYMDAISFKYTNAPFPNRGPDRVCFVIAVEKAAQKTLSFAHNPG